MPVPETCRDINRIIDQIEEIRSSNAALREWGAEQYDRAEEAENNLSEAKYTIEDLRSEIESLKEELKEAQLERA